MLVRDVVGDDVDDRADAELTRLRDQLLGLPERPERRIDRAVVGDVVAGVSERRRIPGVEPQRVDAERGQVWQSLPDPCDVADPIAVGVGEASDVNLVNDRVAPPGALLLGAAPTSRSGAGAASCPSPSWRRRWHSRQMIARARDLNFAFLSYLRACQRKCLLQRAVSARQGALAVEPRATTSGSKKSSSAETGEPSICPPASPRRHGRSPRSAAARSSAVGRCSS